MQLSVKYIYICVCARDPFFFSSIYARLDIIHSGEAFEIKEGTKMPTQKTCERCGYMSSNELCKACVLLEGLQRGLPQMGIGKASKAVSDEHTKSDA